MKNYKYLLFIMALVVLSGCNLRLGKGEAELPANAELSPTPTLSKDDSIESIESDLKATTILDEDFSDIN